MKTLAIRLEDDQHAQLSVLAQLAGNTITDEIRAALESHIQSKRSDPTLTAKAQGVLEDIERQAHARQAAITTLFGGSDTLAPESTTTEAKKTNGKKTAAADAA